MCVLKCNISATPAVTILAQTSAIIGICVLKCNISGTPAVTFFLARSNTRLCNCVQWWQAPALPRWSNTIVLYLCNCVFLFLCFCISVQRWRTLHFLDDQTQSFSPLDATLSRLTVQLWSRLIDLWLKEVRSNERNQSRIIIHLSFKDVVALA